MDDAWDYCLEAVDHLLESKHERYGSSDEFGVDLGDVTLYADKTDASYLSLPVSILKVLQDAEIVLVIGDFKLPGSATDIIIRWLLVGVKNDRDRFQLAIMHELCSEFD